MRQQSVGICVDVNVLCLNCKDEKHQQKVVRVHQALFNDQPDDITFGFLNIMTSQEQNLFQELSDVLQSIEYKIYREKERIEWQSQQKQSEYTLKQLCLILCSTASDTTNDCIEPISLIKSAKNEHNGEVVSMHAPKQEILYTNMQMQKVADKYQQDMKTSANPFRQIEMIEDADINRLYYVALLESKSRQCDCLLVQINNQTGLMDEQRIATRITQVIRRWQCA